MTGNDSILTVNDLRRTVAYHKILKGVSFELERGEALAVVGPNGAGKTTLLRVLTGLARKTSGAVAMHGKPGLVAHSTMLYDALSARENLDFFARLDGSLDGAVVDRLLDMVRLTDRQHDRVGTYSRGMTQRLSIARALLAEPDVLFLDEPLSGLDDRSTRAVIDIIADMRRQGRAVVFVTHNFNAVVQIATRVGYLVGGRMAALEELGDRSADEVANRYREVVDAA